MAPTQATKIDLLLLGLLLDQPMHGYELYQEIQAEGIDDWFSVSMAGVYYSLGKLRDQGLVAESRQRGGRSPRRSIYRLTEEGRSAFFAAMEAQATSRVEIYLDYDLIIYLLSRLPMPRAMSLLEQYQAFLLEQACQVQAAIQAEQMGGDRPPRIAVLDHKRRYLEMEQSWLSDVIRSIRGPEREGDRMSGERGSLMVLTGDLRHYHLPELLRLIVSGQHSGTLTVTDGLQIRTLTLEQGQLAYASSRRRDEPPLPPPSPEQVLAGVYDLFRWQEGEFNFDQGATVAEWDVPLDVTADALILGGCRWVDNWATIQRLVPSADTIFERGQPGREVDILVLSENERHVLAAVDGRRDVATMARDLELTVFEASRALYCLAAVGLVRTADLDKIRLRRVFREIAELMCSSTIAWRSSPDDRACEEEVNQLTAHLSIDLNRGRIEDRTDPQLKADDLAQKYRAFLMAQLVVIIRRFGRENACQSFERTHHQLAPELQDVAKRYGFDKLLTG